MNCEYGIRFKTNGNIFIYSSRKEIEEMIENHLRVLYSLNRLQYTPNVAIFRQR